MTEITNNVSKIRSSFNVGAELSVNLKTWKESSGSFHGLAPSSKFMGHLSSEKIQRN